MDENEKLIRKLPPHSQEAEQSVVGSMMLDRDAIAVASAILTEDDFYHKAYALLYTAIVDLDNAGKAVDTVTLQTRLREMDAPEDIASDRTLAELISAVPTSTNVKHYAQIVADKAQLRRLIKTMENLTAVCYADRDKTEDICADAETQLFRVLNNRQTKEITPIHEIVIAEINRIEKASNLRSVVTGLASGFTDLDRLTSGFQPSDLVLIAARPSMGKTAFALNVAGNMAFKGKKRVAVFSLEMSKEQLVDRMFAMESGIDSGNLRRGRLQEPEWDRLIQSATTIAESGLVIDDTPGISAPQIRSKCRRMKLQGGLDCIIIDYLQMMSGGSRKSESRQQEISEISRALKQIARELQVPVLALSQLSRAVEARADHRPQLSDLRESGAIEQDADIVMFLYRDEYYNQDTDQKGVTELIIGKQRNGPLGTVKLAWIAKSTKFASMQREPAP